MATSVDQLIARINDLETRITYQDDTIDTLNQVLVDLRRQLDQVAEHQGRLRDQVLAIQPSSMAADGEEPPPPHY